jgi:GT2 family glycosyltransferase
MVRRSVFEEVGGLDEELSIAFNDVDFCLKVRDAGYYNIYLPHVVLYHFESKSRGADDTPEKLARSNSEETIMQQRWHTSKVDDPFYSPHLTLIAEDFRIRV